METVFPQKSGTMGEDAPALSQRPHKQAETAVTAGAESKKSELKINVREFLANSVEARAAGHYVITAFAHVWRNDVSARKTERQWLLVFTEFTNKKIGG